MAGYVMRIGASSLAHLPLRKMSDDVSIVVYKKLHYTTIKKQYYYDLAPNILKPNVFDAVSTSYENILPIIANRYFIDLGCVRTKKANFQNLINICIDLGVHGRHLDKDDYLNHWCSKKLRYMRAFRKGVYATFLYTIGMLKRIIDQCKKKDGKFLQPRGRAIYHNVYQIIGLIQIEIKVLEESVYALPFVAKKHNQYQRGHVIAQKFYKYGLCFSCDYTQFDGTIDSEALMEQYRFLEFFIGYHCDWFMTDHKVKFMENVFAKCNAKRDSGEALTALGNVIIVLGTLLSDDYIYQQYKLGNLDFYDDGDDNLVFCYPDIAQEVQDHLVQVSKDNHFSLKIDNIASRIEDIVFCKSHMARLRGSHKWMLMRDVVPACSKIFYTFKDPRSKIFKDYLTTMLECYDHIFGDIPLFISLKTYLFKKFGKGKYCRQFYNEIKGRYYIDNSVPIPKIEYFWVEDYAEYDMFLQQINSDVPAYYDIIDVERNPRIDFTIDPYEGKGRLMTDEERKKTIREVNEFI